LARLQHVVSDTNAIEISVLSTDTSLMIRSRLFARACIALLCIAILVMRVGGAHLHLCLDGGEPPVSVHLSADAGTDDSHVGVGKTHHDQEVSLSGEILPKKLDGVLQLPVVLAAAVLLFLLPLVSVPVIPRARTALIHSIPIFRIRPPLRAPPL
jgi:hypothetical protein